MLFESILILEVSIDSNFSFIIQGLIIDNIRDNVKWNWSIFPIQMELTRITRIIKRTIIPWTFKLEKAILEVIFQRRSVKKVFLEISQNPQENTCGRVSFLIKLQAIQLYLKKRLWHSCFRVNFVKFLRTPFFEEHPWWLLLQFEIRSIVLLAIFQPTKKFLRL